MAHTLAAVFGKRVLAGNLRAGDARALQLDKIKTSRPNRRDGSFLCE